MHIITILTHFFLKIFQFFKMTCFRSSTTFNIALLLWFCEIVSATYLKIVSICSVKRTIKLQYFHTTIIRDHSQEQLSNCQ